MSYERYQMMTVHINNISAIGDLIKHFIQFNIAQDLK